MDRLIRDISCFASDYAFGRKVDSIFFGGGTPTVLPVEELIRVLNHIKTDFCVASDCEISIESNPGSLNLDKLKALEQGGFNRLSIGVQSFDDGILKTLGRIHDSHEAKRAFWDAKEAGFENINLDLMFGIPGQSLGQWRETLEEAISLRPNHISFYSLQIEEGTPYYESFEKGRLVELPEDEDREMYHTAIRMLKDGGYKHYEISNGAFPGFECRHNLKYWTLKEYLGIGPSASSYIEGKRMTFEPDIDGSDFSEYHINSPFDNMSEYMFTGLRLSSGVYNYDFRNRFGMDIKEAFQDRWHELGPFFKRGDLVQYVDNEGNPSRLAITEKGFDIANKIMSIFV